MRHNTFYTEHTNMSEKILTSSLPNHVQVQLSTKMIKLYVKFKFKFPI